MKPGRQFLVYVTVGLLSAAVDVGLLYGLLVLGVDYRIATTAGYSAGLVFNYLAHLRVTFPGQPGLGSAVRYASVVALNYLLTLGLVTISVALWQQPLAGKLVALPVVALVGYTAGRAWIFR